MSTEDPMRGPRLSTYRLLLCGVAAGPLFVVVFTVAGALRADYDPLRHPVSALSLTGVGWVQIVNFLVTGVLLVLFAVGARRALNQGALGRKTKAGAKPWLLGMGGVGLFGAGLFPGDPLSGYPPGTPDHIVYTPPGIAHDALSMLFFLGIPLACAAFTVWSLRTRRWVLAAYSVLSAIGFLTFFFVASEGFVQTPGFVEWGGLNQRVSIAVGLAWTTVVALVLTSLTRARESQPRQDAGDTETSAPTRS